jgi:periplasmic divalent cation tolerance protein
MTTVGSAGEGESLARLIIEAKLAACVQILPKMMSVYFWDGKTQAEPEHLLLIKTLEEKFDALSEFIEQNHGYDVPEILAVSAEKFSEEYLNWMRSVTSR